MIGKLKALSARTYIEKDKLFLTFELPTNSAWEAQRYIAEANSLLRQNKPLAVMLDKWHDKRSRDANSYAWVLIHKLSDVLALPPIEIYRDLVQAMGDESCFDDVWIKDEAVTRYRAAWESNGLGWPTVLIDKNKGFTHLYCYYGSSTYDTAQMSKLIELIIQECQQQDIETMPPAKLAALVQRWAA